LNHEGTKDAQRGTKSLGELAIGSMQLARQPFDYNKLRIANWKLMV